MTKEREKERSSRPIGKRIDKKGGGGRPMGKGTSESSGPMEKKKGGEQPIGEAPADGQEKNKSDDGQRNE